MNTFEYEEQAAAEAAAFVKDLPDTYEMDLRKLREGFAQQLRDWDMTAADRVPIFAPDLSEAKRQIIEAAPEACARYLGQPLPEPRRLVDRDGPIAEAYGDDGHSRESIYALVCTSLFAGTVAIVGTPVLALFTRTLTWPIVGVAVFGAYAVGGGIIAAAGMRFQLVSARRVRARRAVRGLHGRYVTPALDLDRAGRELMRRARTAVEEISAAASVHDMTLDVVAHQVMLTDWLWSLATQEADLTRWQAKVARARSQGPRSDDAGARSQATIDQARGALESQVTAIEQYAGRLRSVVAARKDHASALALDPDGAVLDLASALEGNKTGMAALKELISAPLDGIQEA